MATIVLSAAGAALGSGIGGTALGLSGSVIGRAIGASVGQSIDQRILGSGSEAVEVGKVDRFRLSGVGYGVPIKEIWGRMRVAGEIIWASRFMQSVRRSGGGKGAPRQTTDSLSYSVSLAIALCRGEATSIGRIWADGLEIATNSINFRFYPGGEDQLPDAKIEAVEGVGFAPAYRGICYVVIEDLQLSLYGNRVPQFSFEVIRPAQGGGTEAFSNMQKSVNAVALIPGSGEYALATSTVRFDLAPGISKTANIHSVQGVADFLVSLDQLTNELPNCGSVSMVVSWFGNDLRCGHCSVQPKVEQKEIEASNMPWEVSGVTRSDAAQVPWVDGRPIYGGTPTDRSVIEAIQAIRSSGKEVMFYPFILMDQLIGNTLPDPWSESSTQPALPWRGRITLNRAPGREGTTDQSAEAVTEIGAFLGEAEPSDFSPSGNSVFFSNSSEWGYRRFVLHYAHLCVLAGGVDAFCIGSELRGLTQIREAGNHFPMVSAFRQLAREVKSILGDNTKVSYAADWSEYFGYHIGEDVIFNLDPLWSDANIDFIGIDNYMPVTDWRDEAFHADAQWKSIYNIDYILANIAGGEGFDWYYKSLEEEYNQIRSPIEDRKFGEDWVFRYKDIQGWWSNTHHDRYSGVRSDLPTGWWPGMKPIRFTEYGCAALDKATNQPNKFLDAKSSESSLPRSSNGQRDDFIQMQYLHAMAVFWNSSSKNPVSDIYLGRMVDFDRSHVWAWDARPYPDFPGNRMEWSDGVNYARGHWLNGRSTNQSLASVISEFCIDLVPSSEFDAMQIHGSLRGFEVAYVSPTRSPLQSLCLVYSLDVADIDGQLSFYHRGCDPIVVIEKGQLVISKVTADTAQFNRAIDVSSLGRTKLDYIEAENDFEHRSVESCFPDDVSKVFLEAEHSLLLLESEARAVSERWLVESKLAIDSVQLSLPKSALSINCGDVIHFFGECYRVDIIDDTDFLLMNLRRVESGVYERGSDPTEGSQRIAPVVASPLFVTFLDLPLLTGTERPQAPHVAMTANPWRGTASIWSSSTDSGYVLNTSSEAPSIIGVLTSALVSAPPGCWDRGSKASVKLFSGELSSVSLLDVLNGSNVAAIGDGSPENWEIIQFAEAMLVAPDTYDFSLLLRGQLGSNATCPSVWPAGSIFVIIDRFVPQVDLPFGARGLERYFRAGLAVDGYTNPNVSAVAVAFNGIGLRPYSVCHLTAVRRIDNSVVTKWVRRTRIDGDSWQSIEVPLSEEIESYFVRIIDAEIVVRETVTNVPFWIYTPLMQLEDQISANFMVSVAQSSHSFGPGPFVTVGLL